MSRLNGRLVLRVAAGALIRRGRVGDTATGERCVNR